MIDPKTLKYAESHEWVALEGDVATIGISRFAVDQLTDIIHLDLTRAGMGSKLEKGKTFGEVESVKAVADLYAPISGEVVAVNEAVEKDVQVLAEDPYNKGWLLKVKVTDPGAAVAGLMNAADYEKTVERDMHD